MQREDVERVLACVDEKRVVNLARRLIMIPSVGYISKPVVEDTAECASFCGEYMERFGCEIKVQEDIGKQAIGTLKGEGGGRSLMLCGHLDTSPVSKGWRVDPYGGVIEGDRIYGPGADNMKEGVAAMIAAAEALSRSGLKLRGDLVIAPVFGERVGGTGVKALLRTGIRTDYAIVPEPTGLGKIGIESTGAVDGAIHVHGVMGFLKGVNALDKMWRLLTFMGLPSENCLVLKPTWLRSDLGAETPSFFVGALDAGIGDKYLHEPKGSSDICTAYFDVRPTYLDVKPTEQSVLEDLERALEKFGAEDPDFRAYLECPILGAINGIAMKTPSNAEVVQTLAEWAKYVTAEKPQIGEGSRGKPQTRGGSGDYFPRASWNYQDGGHLSRAGIVTCVYGPSGGGPNNCPNEFNSLSEIVKATKILALTAAEICAQ
jgi:acetylornithine deacetylase